MQQGRKVPITENFKRLQVAWEKCSSQGDLLSVDLTKASINDTINAMAEGMSKLNTKVDELHLHTWPSNMKLKELNPGWNLCRRMLQIIVADWLT